MASSYARRPRGDGSIYQDTAGRWRATLSVRDPATGELVRRYVSGRSRTAAARELARLRELASEGRAARSQTLAAYVAAWLPTYRPTVRHASYLSAAGSLERILPLLGDVPLAELSPARVTAALAALIGEGLSPLRVRNIRAILRRALADAERSGQVTRNAAALARPPRVPHRAIAYIPPTALPTLLDELADRGREGAPFVLAITTGLRAGELCGLRWREVTGDTLAVRRAIGKAPGGWAAGDTKTGHGRRTIALPVRARAALEVLDPGEPDAPVVTDQLGRAMTPQDLSRVWRTIRAELGWPTMRLHDLRHTAATAMLASGVPLEVVSRILGHAGIAITLSTYAEVVPELHRDAASALDRMLR